MASSIVRVTSAGVSSVVGSYSMQSPTSIPSGFAKVCKQQNWPISSTWERLSDLKRPWFEAPNGPYMYYNRGDGQWWIDEPNGDGIYVSMSDTQLPPTGGWKPLRAGCNPLPSLVVIDEKEGL